MNLPPRLTAQRIRISTCRYPASPTATKYLMSRIQVLDARIKKYPQQMPAETVPPAAQKNHIRISDVDAGQILVSIPIASSHMRICIAMADQAPHYNVRQSASYSKTLGITQRATPLAFPWAGELRVRFSDFQVNEIGKDGQVVHLRQAGLGDDDKTSQEPPAPQKPVQKADDSNEQSRGSEYLDVLAEDIAALEDLTSAEFAQGVVQLFKSLEGEDSEKKKSVTSEPLERFKRGQVHQEIRRIFKSRIETSTDGTDAIVATLAAPLRRGQKRPRGGRSNRQGAAKPAGGEYLHFTLFKDNRDTMDAVSQIARFLRVKPQVIGYAGTKDRRASTVQRCSVRYTRDRSLAGLNGRLRGITTGDYEYKQEPIRLGELLGNEFVITIKNCETVGETSTTELSDKLDAIRSNVQSALGHMAQHGWINYFGHQRFGTHQIGTHQIGRLILADKFEEAVNSILAYDEETAHKAETEENPEPAKRDEYARHQACLLFRTGKDVEKALELMPKRFTAEGCVMRHLNRQGAQSRRDFVGAVIHITRGLRSMYLHAYQSHVWNHAASRRWELHGSKVVAGDLVISETQVVPQAHDEDDIVTPEDDDEAPVRARPLTSEEAANGQYTIHDIVLPTPGYDVIYPDNEIGEFYKAFMGRKENGSLDPCKMRRLRREFSLPGRYRKLMNKFLAEPSVELRAYSDDEEQMHPTDLDILNRGDERPSKLAKVDATQEKIAAIVKFQLGRSAYATVTLRELMGDPPSMD